MNRIKEVLEKKGIKQTWLAEKLGKNSALSIPMFAIDTNQASKPSSRLWRYWEWM